MSKELKELIKKAASGTKLSPSEVATLGQGYQQPENIILKSKKLAVESIKDE